MGIKDTHLLSGFGPVIGMLSDDSCKTQTWVTNTSLIREATLVHPAITVGLSLQSEL